MSGPTPTPGSTGPPGAAAAYVSRGGVKLAAALEAFGLDPRGAACADLGCNAGGFTDCLLQRGASRVYAVDTGYGALAWKLRQDPRVVVLERTNALYLDPRTLEGFTGADLVVIDLAWTRQSLAVPAALRWLRPGGRIVTLIKPHYEFEPPTDSRGGGDRNSRGSRGGSRFRGVLDADEAKRVLETVLASLPAWGVRVAGAIPSPIRGGAGKRRVGNVEYLALLEPAPVVV